jgi:dTDP-4-dehydrorhamnose reductase
MQLLLTGSRGTVGGAVADAARAEGWSVTPWDRAQASPDDPAATDRIFERTAPDAILHLAMGAPSWAGRMAGRAQSAGIPFVFTSTASVFAPPGPHRPFDARNAGDDYGRYKIECEDQVRAASDDAVTVRLGYQISLTRGGNNMAAHLREQAAGGSIRASKDWIPATSMLDDTAAVLLALLTDPRPGLHHLDANAEEAWSYVQIVRAIAGALHLDWPIHATHDRADDQRLLNSLPIAPLSARLPLSA